VSLDALAAGADIVELSHAMDAAMPVYPHHVPFTLTLNRRHGDAHPAPRIGNSSFASHTETHIDALGHFSRCGLCTAGTRRTPSRPRVAWPVTT